MTANPNPNPNPNPNTNSITPMEPRSRALTLVLAFVLAVHSPLPGLSSAVHSPSASPSPSPAPLLPPPKQLMADPAGRRPSPPATSLHFRPPHAGFNCPGSGCHHVHNPGATAVPPHREWKLNFGQLMGITLAAVALALQVALGGFLVYKRLQLRKAEMQYRQRLGPSSSASSS